MTWKFIDIDNDGKNTVVELFTVLRIALYLFAGMWSVIHVNEFSDVKFIAIIAASFGASTFETFLKTRNNERDKGNFVADDHNDYYYDYSSRMQRGEEGGEQDKSGKEVN